MVHLKWGSREAACEGPCTRERLTGFWGLSCIVLFIFTLFNVDLSDFHNSLKQARSGELTLAIFSSFFYLSKLSGILVFWVFFRFLHLLWQQSKLNINEGTFEELCTEIRAGWCPLGFQMAQPTTVLLCVTQIYLQLDLVILKVSSHILWFYSEQR